MVSIHRFSELVNYLDFTEPSKIEHLIIDDKMHEDLDMAMYNLFGFTKLKILIISKGYKYKISNRIIPSWVVMIIVEQGTPIEYTVNDFQAGAVFINYKLDDDQDFNNYQDEFSVTSGTSNVHLGMNCVYPGESNNIAIGYNSVNCIEIGNINNMIRDIYVGNLISPSGCIEFGNINNIPRGAYIGNQISLYHQY